MFGAQNNREKKNPNALIIGMYAIAAGGLAYSISFYLLRFMYYSNTEKVLVISGLSFFLFSLLLFIPKSLILQITEGFFQNSYRKRLIFIIIAVGLSISAFFTFLPSLPTLNNFELTILEDGSESGTETELEILQIDRLGINNQIISQVSPYDLTLNGNWIIEKKSLSISSSGGDNIQLKDFSNYGISLLFLKSPDSGKVQINWNGNSQIIDLKSDSFDQIVIDFPHSFSFYQLSFFRFVQIVLLLISNFIFFVFVYFLFLIVVHKIRELNRFFINLLIYQKTVLFLLLIVIFINVLAFSRYQSHDVFKLRRTYSNSLIALDNSSDDNFPYFQVYYKISKYFKGQKLIVPREIFTDGKVITQARLKSERLLELGRLRSVVEDDYSSELTISQIEKINKMKRDFVPPVGRIPNDFVFILEPNSQDSIICMWWSKETVFFIPLQSDFDCQRGNQ